ncbi:unnamed protein product, partial [marine sediment metagenome]
NKFSPMRPLTNLIKKLVLLSHPIDLPKTN